MPVHVDHSVSENAAENAVSGSKTGFSGSNNDLALMLTVDVTSLQQSCRVQITIYTHVRFQLYSYLYHSSTRSLHSFVLLYPKHVA